MLDCCVLGEQRNKQPFPMNTVCPDGTISYTFPQLLTQTILTSKVTSNFFKKFAVLLVKNMGF